MSPTPSRPEPADLESPNCASQRDEDAQYYRQVLHELIDMGADLARALHKQVTSAPTPDPAAAPAPDPAIAFDRIARTIRRTIALARKLAEPAPPSPAAQAAERRVAARKRIIRDVEDTIQREAHGPEADALHAEFRERLDAPDLDDDLDHLPIADLIAAICRDLGIAHYPGTHPWKRRTPADVRDLCARAARPTTAQPRTAQPRTAQPRTGHLRTLHAPPPRTRTGTGPPPPAP
jgi:hypothetical protein